MIAALAGLAVAAAWVFGPTLRLPLRSRSRDERRARREYLANLENICAGQAADPLLPAMRMTVRRPVIYRELTPEALKAAADERLANTSDRLPAVVDDRPVHAFVPGQFSDDGDPFGEYERLLAAPKRPVLALPAGTAPCEPVTAAGTGPPPDEVDWDPDREGPNLCNGCLDDNHCDGGASFCECTCGLPEDWADAIEPTHVLPPHDVMVAALDPSVAEWLSQFAADADTTFVRKLHTAPLDDIPALFDGPLALPAGVS